MLTIQYQSGGNIRILKVKYYKVPSGELTNLPLLERLKKTKKFIFLSTGMSNYQKLIMQ